jgi:hypothetical protein
MGEHYPPEKVEERLSGRVIAAAILQTLIATASASAKRVYEPGFSPPPYPERVFDCCTLRESRHSWRAHEVPRWLLVTRTDQIKSGR